MKHTTAIKIIQGKIVAIMLLSATPAAAIGGDCGCTEWEQDYICKAMRL